MKPAGVLLLTVGIFLGIFPRHQVSSFPSSDSSWGKLRIGLHRISKSNGNSNGAEYATHRPYKSDFDLLRVSERSHEMGMPFIFSNSIDGDTDAAIRILTSDPVLRSRRRRQVQSSPDFNFCIPFVSSNNPMCRQLFFGMNPPLSNNPVFNAPPTGQRPSALAVPSSSSAFFIPSSSLSHHTSHGISPAGTANLNRNEFAILANYYQPQQLPPQSPPLQVGVFQGPVPAQRQRPQYDNIHTKYPYPYPPTLDVSPQSPAVPESVGAAGENQQQSGTTDYPVDVSGGTTLPQAVEQQQEGNQGEQGSASSVPSGAIPDSPGHQQGSAQESSTEAVQDTQASSLPSSTPVSPGQQQDDPSLNQQLKLQELNMQKRLREKEEENRRLRSQLEQANLQVVSYEQENAIYKDQFQRSEEANIKLRDRVLQLENTNQHLQDQNGKLQQTTNEQRQQINGLKATQKEMKDQLTQFQQQMQPLSNEVQKHRKEIEDFLIRIRSLGEENETCKKQVKLYQLKINYIQDQQRQQNKDKDQQAIQDDELDPELSRMDAEIAALNNGAEAASTIQSFAPTDLKADSTPSASSIPESAVPSKTSDQKVVSPQVVEKKESEFPGEAVQIPQRAQQPEQTAPKTVVTAEDVGRAPTWEEPAGF